MTFNDLERKRIEKSVDAFLEKKRPPPHVRAQLDFGFKWSGQSVELLEIRPQWDNPAVIREQPFAKATYVMKTGMWKIFCQRADLKWHAYPPAPEVKDIEEFLTIVERDEYACFFG